MDENRRYMVLTAVGPDRPGLVNHLSSFIREADASIEDSRMAILGGEFAMILLISGPPARSTAPRRAAPASRPSSGCAAS